MQKQIVSRLAFTTLLAVGGGLALPASAKLPAPTEEAKQKAAEAAARNAWTDKVAAYKLCLAMDRVAEQYRRTSMASGKQPPSPVDTAPCADPGPLTPITPVAQKPIEASEAHSPPGTATSPPSTNATAAEIQGKGKK
jgi:hypothetical protein